VPAHLRDAHYPGAGKVGHGKGYLYPHDFDDGVVPQRYAPDQVAERRYYEPSRHGLEARVAERAERIRAILGRAGSRTGNRSENRTGSQAEGRTEDKTEKEQA
jgi:putative ATPase